MNEEVLKELREIKEVLQEFKEAETTRCLFPAYESDTKEAATPSIEEQFSLGTPGETITLQAPHSEPDILYRWIEAQTALAQQIVRERKESIHKDISEKPESITSAGFERLMHDWIRGNRNRIKFASRGEPEDKYNEALEARVDRLESEQVAKEYTKKKYVPFTDEDAEKLARDGERYASRGFVKAYGFEEAVAFTMSLTRQIWGLLQENKGFRMELHHDPETLNTNYCFFVPIDQCGSDGTSQVSPED